jgi:hypothetical protein
MKWEYACITGTTKRAGHDAQGSLEGFPGRPLWVWNFVFYGPDGSKELTGESAITILNSIGQDGWEVLGVETLPGVNGATVRNFWLRRTARH